MAKLSKDCKRVRSGVLLCCRNKGGGKRICRFRAKNPRPSK